MGLWDFAASAAKQYGPALMARAQQALAPQGPAMGFAAPARPGTVPARGAEEYMPRRRRAGLTARDIKGAQKVARVVQAFGYKPKMQHRKKRR